MIAIAISNQKGGVGKTTTCVNLAAEFGKMGYSTLAVDIDPQAVEVGNSLGINLYQGRYIQRLLMAQPRKTIFSIKKYY